MIKMNDHIVNYTLKDYSAHTPTEGIVLDCTLGVNQEDMPDLVLDSLRNFQKKDQNEVKLYPHSVEIEDRLAEYYRGRGLAWITPDHITIGAGSCDILFSMNQLCLTAGKKAYGAAPAFSANIDDIYTKGSTFEYCTLKEESNYKFNVDDYLAGMNDSYALFILENPNNPTGQIIPIESARKIAERAAELNTILLVDEAYGDYMEAKDSALNLVDEFPNVAVSKSVSKGFGLAGLRLGYLVAKPGVDGILPQYRKVISPFSCSAISRMLAVALFDSGANTMDIEQVKKNNERILGSLTKLKAFETSLRTPITTLFYDTDDKDFDLQAHLLKSVGLAVVGCGGYDGLDARSIRLMMPRTEYMDQLIDMLTESQNQL